MKKICIIASGYAEEMMSAKLLKEIKIELQNQNLSDEYLLLGGSLVSSGRWFQEEGIDTFFNGGMTPSGGFPFRTVKGFFADLFGGAFISPFVFRNEIKKIKDIEVLIVLADTFFLWLAEVQKNSPIVFLPTARSNYHKAHNPIQKQQMKDHATVVFPRDLLTSDDFTEYGINSIFFGNLMQDLLNPNAPKITSDEPMIALLPGSREETYGNLNMMLKVVIEITTPIHWAFVQAGSLDSEKIDDVFVSDGWTKKDNTWTKGVSRVYVYKGIQFDSVALSCDFAISQAGTVGDQIAGLGKPVIGFVGTGAQSSTQRMIEYENLWGEAFIYERDYPKGVIQDINRLLNSPQEREDRGKVGLQRMGEAGATKKIAQYIVENFIKK